MKSIIQISHEHGEAMYTLGLKHAIGVLESRPPEAALAHLREQLREREATKIAVEYEPTEDTLGTVDGSLYTLKPAV